MQILLFLFFSLLIGFFSKRNILTCGIWGWSGSSVALFNPDRFNMLGFFNDSRGGDGAGRFMDGKIIKGVEKLSEYCSLVTEYPIQIPKNLSVIGHARKASIGDKDLENVQPFYIKKNDKTIGIFCHNGTIHNIEELCKKYSVKFKDGRSDTYHFGHLLFKVGHKVLSDYEGTGAFVWIDYKEPDVVYCFRGQSKLTEWATVESEERPLYCYRENFTIEGRKEYSLWFSSMGDSLEATFQINPKRGNGLEYFIPNRVYKIDKGRIISSTEIVRNPIYRKTKVVSFPATIYPLNNGTVNYEKDIDINWLEEPYPSAVYNMLEFTRGRYFMNGALANRGYRLNNIGEDVGPNGQGKNYYFVNGVRVRDRGCYEAALSSIAYKKYPYATFQMDILSFTDDPVSVYLGEEWSTAHAWAKVRKNDPKYSKINQWDWYDGVFVPIFSRKCYTFENGEIRSITTLKEKEENTEEKTEEKGETILAKAVYDSCISVVAELIKDIDNTITTMEAFNCNEVVIEFTPTLEDAAFSLMELIPQEKVEELYGSMEKTVYYED